MHACYITFLGQRRGARVCRASRVVGRLQPGFEPHLVNDTRKWQHYNASSRANAAPTETQVPTRLPRSFVTSRALMAKSIDHALRLATPCEFAGCCVASDGALEVYATRASETFLGTLAASIDDVKSSRAPGTPLPAIRIVDGQRNSLSSLEAVADRVRDVHSELQG